MPDFTTHYLLGERVIERMSHAVSKQVSANIDAFRWGLQGPDILYFSEIIRSRGNNIRIGIQLHSMNSNRLIAGMLDYILKHGNTPSFDVLRAYAYGFVCHYVLDKNCHPFVNFFAGELKDLPFGAHARIESEIDSLMYRLMTGRLISNFTARNYYPYDGAFRRPVAKMYVSLVMELLGKDLPLRQADKSFASCCRINNATYGRHARAFYHSARNLETLIHRRGLFSSYTKFDIVTRDTLNLKKRGWYNLNNPSDRSDMSFPELFESSASECLELISNCLETFSSGRIVPLKLTANFDNGTPRKK